MMSNKRTIVDTTDVDGKKIKLSVNKPTNKQIQEANMAYNLRMSELIRSGSKSNQRLMLRAELDEYLQEMGIWTLKDQLEVEKLALEIRASELKLKQGGIKVSEGKSLALQMAEKRRKILDKHAKRLQFDSATIESQADNFRFEYLLVRCLTHADDGKQYLKNHDDYLERQDEVAIVDGAKALANMLYGLDSNVTDNMYEMQWLKNAGMIDDDGKYRGKDGTTVDRDGRLVDENGRYINNDGQLIDTFGRLVDENGNLIVEDGKPFIDDETGEEIDIFAKKQKKNKKSKKRSSKSKRK